MSHLVIIRHTFANSKVTSTHIFEPDFNGLSVNKGDAFLKQITRMVGGDQISARLDNIICGPGSSVGIATGYGLDGPGIESRWGARFFAPVQTGPGAHPASCTVGTVSFPGVKSGRGVTLTPHPLLVPWSLKGRTIPLLPL
jgi:hypothetical protein